MQQGIAVLLIALAAFRLLGGREETVTYESRPTVTLETPQANDIVLYTEMIGTVEPVSKADVIPQNGRRDPGSQLPGGGTMWRRDRCCAASILMRWIP